MHNVVEDMVLTLADALEFHKRGQRAEAVRTYRMLLADRPDDFNINRLLGLCLKNSDDDGAVYHLRRAAAIWPHEPQPWLDLADLPEKVRPASLEVLFREAAARMSELLGLVKLAFRAHEAGLHELVLELCDRIMSLPGLEPVEFQVRSLRLTTRLLQERFGEASEDVPFLSGHPRTSDDVLINISYGLGRLGSLAEAESLLHRVLARNPGHAAARGRFAQVMQAQGRYEEALEGTLGRGVDAVLDDIDRAIGAAVPMENSVVGILCNLRHIGHSSYEPQVLRTAFPGRRPVLLVDSLAADAVSNPEIVKLYARTCTFVECGEPWLLKLRLGHSGRFERNGRIYVLDAPNGIGRLMGEVQRAGTVIASPPALTDEQQERGRALQRRLGIPEDAAIVVVHIRQPGFHGSLYPSRCADPETYRPLAAWLLREGYHVIRIGDPSMTRLDGMGPGFFDMPFHSAYTSLVEPYFIARAEFVAAMNSGPCELARALQKPLMLTNIMPFFVVGPMAFELAAFKKIRDRKTGRGLSYQEILEQDMCVENDFEYAPVRGFDVEPLSAEEILLVGREMSGLIRRYGSQTLAKLDIEHGFPASDLQKTFYRVARDNDRLRNSDPKYKLRGSDYLAIASPRHVLSDEYGFVYPDIVRA